MTDLLISTSSGFPTPYARADADDKRVVGFTQLFEAYEINHTGWLRYLPHDRGPDKIVPMYDPTAEPVEPALISQMNLRETGTPARLLSVGYREKGLELSLELGGKKYMVEFGHRNCPGGDAAGSNSNNRPQPPYGLLDASKTHPLELIAAGVPHEYNDNGYSMINGSGPDEYPSKLIVVRGGPPNLLVSLAHNWGLHFTE